MTAAAWSPFCEHRRLRTGCADCKPKPEPAMPGAAPGVPAEMSAQREAPPKKQQQAPARRPRKRVKPPTREEAENAVAWWVQKPRK